MQAFAIVEAFDVANDGDSCGVACREALTMDEFVLPKPGSESTFFCSEKPGSESTFFCSEKPGSE